MSNIAQLVVNRCTFNCQILHEYSSNIAHSVVKYCTLNYQMWIQPHSSANHAHTDMIVSRRTGMYRYIPAQCVCHVDSHDAGPLSRTGKRMHHTRRYLLSRPVYALSPPARGGWQQGVSRLGTDHSQETKVPINCSSQFKGPAVYQSSAKGGRQCRFHNK